MTTLLLMAPQAVSDNQIIIVMMFKFLCIIIILSGMLSQLPSSLPPVAHPKFMLSTPEYVWLSGKYIKAGTKWPIFGRQHLKCIFLNKIVLFWLKFYWNLFIWVKLPISHHWFRYWFGTIMHQANIWTNVDPKVWCHMTSLGHNELKVPHGRSPWGHWKLWPLVECLRALEIIPRHWVAIMEIGWPQYVTKLHGTLTNPDLSFKRNLDHDKLNWHGTSKAN